MNNQISIQQSTTQLYIDIRMNGHRFKSEILYIQIFMIFWIFITIAISLIGLQSNNDGSQPILILWVLASAFIVSLNFYFIAWLKNAHEELTFNTEYLIFKKHLPLKQTTEYKINLADIHNLHFEPWVNPWRGIQLPSTSKGNIHFRAKYNLKHSFGINLSEAEANNIIIHIDQWIKLKYLD